MGCIRPATPGFILTTIATALLAVVSFCVPYFKSVFFLKADISVSGVSGAITFGTLGYCIEVSGNTTCSSPTVGYELDINSLIDLPLNINIPNVVVKWLTYALVLHIVALALAAGSAVFGLLAHVREMSMACCSTCISGFAAAVALAAFIFDLVLFFVAKSRINAVGSASMGNAIWLTLAAWILLFFSGCFYTLGRCCISNRSKRGDWDRRQEPPPPGAGDQMRLDAVKAEADRKARQKASEGGLPAFHESQPLTTTAFDDGNNVYTDKPATPGGYVQGTPGHRAVDQYYNDDNAGYSNNNNNAYPPAPQRQYPPSNYAPSTYSYHPPGQQSAYPAQQYNSTPPVPQHTMSPPHQYNSTPPPQQYHTTPPPERMMSPAQQYAPQPQHYADPNPYLGVAAAHAPREPSNPYLGVPGHAPRDASSMSNPYLGVAGGHAARGTSYHSAVSHHGGEYSQYDPYDEAAAGGQTSSAYYTPQSQYPQSAYGGQSSNPQSQYSPHTQPTMTPPQGNGYGANSVPPLETGGYFPQAEKALPQPQASASSMESPRSPTSPRGPRSHRQSLNVMNQDEPPQYEAGSEHIPGAFGKN
ncbi:SUR7/PalI family-domain-containing protein [Favolaschia claudopus]|uniref:SUR7/PalI family-domain-containing protein n=1 Tax=Favolaschia claudopus TaxID=2862362 RepID=A0AAW0EFW9_9AGAR